MDAHVPTPAPTASLVGGDWRADGPPIPVHDKYHLTTAYELPSATIRDVEDALAAASSYAGSPLPPAERAVALHRAAALLDGRRTVLRETMAVEAGFPARDADGETARAIATLTLSAEEATRIAGEMVPIDAAAPHRLGFTLRVPVGIVVAITPFNAPLNTPCHKLGPALAAGNAVILKPSEKAPGPAAQLAAALLEAGFPPGAVQLLQGGPDIVRTLLADTRPAFYAFTGSTEVGRAIQAAAGLRRTQMELGSIAATIVLADADLATAAVKCAAASFRKAGQVCTSIQTLYVEEAAQATFAEHFLVATRALTPGDPRDPATDIGPLISEDAALRVEALIDGCRILAGGDRQRAVISPTVVADPTSAFLSHEAFGPVVALIPVAGIDEAIARVNATPYGLATGLFTRDLPVALDASRRLHVGGVHINETSSSRVDLMPYGGVKMSGFGQEGPRYAVREVTHDRLVTIAP